MAVTGSKLGSGQGRDLWILFLLLVLVVVVPTACVLWFMNKAMDSERLVVRQKLTEIYSGQLRSLLEKMASRWLEWLVVINSIIGSQSSAFEAFRGR